MIDRVTGTLLAVEPAAVVVDWSGLGLRVEVTSSTAERLGPLGSTVTLLTLFALVGSQEPQPRLYGFQTPEARALFLLLRQVSGIGPSTALRVLGAQGTPADVAAAIAQGDVDAIKVKGVGPKIAKRVITELKDKMGAVLECIPAATPSQAVRRSALLGGSGDRALEDAFLALKGLEFDPQRARELLGQVRVELDGAEADELVRAVLLRA